MKEFVLGMESLLISNATEQFGSDNIVVIPMATIEELEAYDGYPEETKNAKTVLKKIREIGIRKLIDTGFVQNNGSLLKVALDVPKERGRSKKMNLPFATLSSYDKRRFEVCKYLMETKTTDIDDVILISMNESARLRADYLGIKAEEPKFRLFPVLEEQYKGQKEITVSDNAISALYDSKNCEPGLLDIPENTLFPNSFLSLQSYSGNSALAFYEQGKEIKLLNESMVKLTSGFAPLNKSQLFLMYSLLVSPLAVPIVICKGVAGTGKTFCSLVAGFAQTKGISWGDNVHYKRVLVSAPMLDEKVKKIGAVKGGLEDKLNPYTAGILDNVNEILNFNKYFKYKGKSSSEKSKRSRKKSGNSVEVLSSDSTPLASSVNSSANSSTSKSDVVREIMDDGLFRIISLDLLRGRTFTDSFYIVDEAQNIRPEEMKTILTRIGKGSKIILLGDPSQTDAKGLNERYNGLTYASELLKGKPFCCQVGFDEDESVRSSFVKEILKLF